MTRPKTQPRTSQRVQPSARLTPCPYCTESLRADKIHICPVGCCYVGPRGQAAEAVCPYCSESFVTRRGHVCMVLVRLTEPAQ